MKRIFKKTFPYTAGMVAAHQLMGMVKSTGNIFVDIALILFCGAIFAAVVTPVVWLILRVQGRDPETFQFGSR